jgi:hypothetical protein
VQAAPGEIIRGADDYLIVLMDTRYWVDDLCTPKGKKLDRTCAIQHQIAGGKGLYLPPVAKLDNKEKPDPKGNILPSVYFPKWTHCPTCGSAYRNPWYTQQSVQPKCNNQKCQSRRQLIQLPWVLVHNHGFLDEVPWHWLCHQKGNSEQKKCTAHEQLSIKTNSGQITIHCKACACKSEFAETAIKSSDFFKKHQVMRQQPWISEPVPENTFDNNIAVAMQAGDAGIFNSIKRDALVLPPESRISSNNCVSQLMKHKQFKELMRTQEGSGLRYRGLLNKVARELSCPPEELSKAMEGINEQQCDPLKYSVLTDGQLLELEYKALMTKISNLSEDEDFVPRHKTDQWRRLTENSTYTGKIQGIIQLISHVVKVERLRKIQVFQGFTRGRAGKNGEEVKSIYPDINGAQSWYPAIELFGEGIFICLDDAIIQQWERHPGIMERVETIRKRWVDSDKFEQYSNYIQLSPRFLLLHTLSHLLIRQLESDAGYPAASLSERIYAQKPHESNDDIEPMAGILIFVAVADKMGSLGGLSNLAEPEKLLTLLDAVFSSAEWCSLDPVCSEHQGQGPDLLNLAACHGCALIPDTACSYGNVLLDRTLIKGGELLPSVLQYVEGIK